MINNILDLLIDTASRYPDKNALVDIDRMYTWNDALNTVRRIASGITAQIPTVCNKNTPIPVIMDRSAYELLVFWGIAYTGNFYVPIDEKMPVERILLILETLEAQTIICDNAGREKLSDHMDGITVINADKLAESVIDEDVIEKCRMRIIDTDPLYALFTSGSTGKPKGVVCCHRSVLSYSQWAAETFDYSETAISGNQTQFYFSMSVFDIYVTLRSGGSLVIIPSNMFMQPGILISFLNEHYVNSIYWVPSALCVISRLKALDEYSISCLRRVLFAGESMPAKQLNYWISKMPDVLYANLFGPTEITDIGVYFIVDRSISDDEPVPIGKPCRNVDIMVLDENDKPVRDGETGELFYRGSFLGMGYYGDEEATGGAYVQNPLNSMYPETVYKSGDLVKRNERGELIFVSRKDSQFKHLGYRIEIGEIENALCSLDGVESGCCIYDGKKDRIIAFVTTNENANLKTDLLDDLLAKKIPRYMMPNEYHIIDDMPLNPNGKIDRRKLRCEYEGN